jgi:hypothetical protein
MRKMMFYLAGRTIPGDTAWFDATPYPSIAEALEGARIRTSLKGSTVVIQDEHGMPILIWPEVQARLGLTPSN